MIVAQLYWLFVEHRRPIDKEVFRGTCMCIGVLESPVPNHKLLDECFAPIEEGREPYMADSFEYQTMHHKWYIAGGGLISKCCQI